MLSHGDDEEKWLVEDIAGIQHNTFYMHHTLVGTQSNTRCGCYRSCRPLYSPYTNTTSSLSAACVEAGS
ncbi:hypothetical protein GW17_00049160 [Ensete ventricosum]|uniref:Uncharacterized protein n=1 Tax=Ensete ventricosum TaxID=4639 RepID=A0A426ZNM9_ENSVE|nr:hypothetical protein B296_00039190 [Ensete ventricosum]RWV88730.1 hypothetical protein GW17_00049160 [Ensete ventricosum]